MYCKTKKRGQVFSIDLIFGISLFLMGLIIFFSYAPQIYSKYSIKSVVTEADDFSDKIISSGVPENWSSLNFSNPVSISEVKVFGITNGNHVLNKTKWDTLNELISEGDYEKIKSIEGLHYDFVVEIPKENMSLGDEGFNESSAKDIVSIKRIIVVNNSPRILKVILFTK